MDDQNLFSSPHLYEVFLDSMREHLEAIEHHALALEQHPADPSLIDALFRSFHTIKGDAGTAGLAEVEQVAHAIECLLEDLRRGKYPVTPPVITVVLQAADVLKSVNFATRSPPEKAWRGVLTGIVVVREHGAEPPEAPEEITVLRVPGPLDLDGTDRLSRQLLQAVDQGCVRLVVDLAAVEFIGSTALGCLAATVQDLRKKGGDLKLVHVHGDVLLKLQMTKLDDVFQLFEDAHAAAKSF